MPHCVKLAAETTCRSCQEVFDYKYPASFQPQGTFYDKKADYAEKSTMGFDVIPGKREDCELAIVSPQPHSKRVLSN